jgi:hypothetical protein
MAQYLNVRQRKLGTIIIQPVHILQHDSADTGSLPLEDFVKHNPATSKKSSPAVVLLHLPTNVAIYGPIIYMAQYIILWWMQIRYKGKWVLEIKTFLGL